MNIASDASQRAFRLKSCCSNTRNGKAKWKTMSITPIYPQPPFIRVRYQVVSSGRLPDQMIRNCEKLKYAQTIVSASISLPRS